MKEIERKFILENMPAAAPGAATPISQGYITSPDDSVEARLRQKGDLYFLTFKRGKGLVREETETPVGKEFFDRLWPMTLGRRVEKKRYKARLENGLWAEIDLFEGALEGLILCEVEFDDEAAAREFIPPEWFGPEVTEDSRYKNKSLASKGMPGK